MRGFPRIAVSLLVAVACSPGSCGPLHPCQADSDCPGPNWYCDPTIHACWGRPDAGSYCAPACLGFEECIQNACSPRYTSLVITSPVEGSEVDASVPVAVSLNLTSGHDRSDPESIVLVALTDGGIPDEVTLPSVDAGLFAGTWHPGMQAQYFLQASWSDAGLLSTIIAVTVDWTPPEFSLSVPSPTRPGPAYLDPALPNAWRRDELVQVSVTSPADDVDPASVRVLLYGLQDGGGMPSPISFPASPSTCDAGYCGFASLDLAAPPMASFDGLFIAVATGQDRAGNAGAGADASSVVPVTRWKWLINPGQDGGHANAAGIAAVGLLGDIYVSAPGTGSVAAYHPDGTEKWTWSPDAGSVGLSVTLGRVPQQAVDRVYVGAGNNVYLLNVPNGSEQPIYSASSGISTWIAVGTSSPPTVNTGIETAFAAVDNELVGITPDIGLGFAPATDLEVEASTMIIQDNQVVAVVPDGGLSSYIFGQQDRLVSSWSRAISGGYFPIPGLWSGTALEMPALVDGGLVLASIGVDSGVINSTSASTFPLVVKTTGELVVLFRPSTSSAAIVGVLGTDGGLVGPTYRPQGSVLSAYGVPAIGAGGIMYLIDAVSLTALSPDLVPLWTVPGPGFVDPVLDCARDVSGSPLQGRPGTLYTAGISGTWAVIVDSSGVEAQSPWPMAGHDPGRTWNAHGDLASYSCP
jgi:hypothetical protein